MVTTKSISGEQKKMSIAFWNAIFHGEKILTDEEANDIEKSIRAMRKQG